MYKNIVTAALLLVAGAAQAQACSCDATATRTASSAELTTLLTNRMVCGQVGSEQWQEWHNGTSSGPVVDYKLGPNVQPDPSTTVGTYVVNADNTVTYNYGSGGGSYTYQVCLASGGATYTFCGARKIPLVKIGGTGLQSCSTVTNSPLPSSTGSRPRTAR